MGFGSQMEKKRRSILIGVQTLMTTIPSLQIDIFKAGVCQNLFDPNNRADENSTFLNQKTICT